MNYVKIVYEHWKKTGENPFENVLNIERTGKKLTESQLRDLIFAEYKGNCNEVEQKSKA